MNAIASTVSGAGQIAAVSVEKVRARIAAIDVMRGLVMLLMLVDHVREAIYVHVTIGDPINPDVPPALFFTRMTAHLCAPTFVFLTGLSAWLYAHPANGPARSPSGFLFKRGLLLLVLEWTLVSFAWYGSIMPMRIYLQVIWIIGLAMIALALFARFPRWVIATTGFVIVFGHNLLTNIHFQPGETGYTFWTLFYEKNYLIPPGGPLMIKVSYPLLPWIGVILLGYAAGPLYARTVSSEVRSGILWKVGLAALALLLVIRGFNIYGETLPWVPGADAIHTVMNFVNFTKYPPSLDFLLLTLGIALILLSRFEFWDNKLSHVVSTYGSAPMFFYLLHLYVLLFAHKLLVMLFGANQGDRFGVDHVAWVWVGSIIMAVLLYLPTKSFAQFKRRSTQAWVRYF